MKRKNQAVECMLAEKGTDCPFCCCRCSKEDCPVRCERDKWACGNYAGIDRKGWNFLRLVA